MTKLEVFDPPMCCSSGICGSNADPVLVNFASDLEWLKSQGIDAIRHNLSLNPDEFAQNKEVEKLLESDGNKILPIVTVDEKIITKGFYPNRKKLAEICKIEYNEDEAPPVHREENCCCGVDCDCRVPQQNEEEICTGPECHYHQMQKDDLLKKILPIIIVFVIMALIIIMLD